MARLKAIARPRDVEDLAAIQERNRIAREIHDSLGHTLTAQNIQLQTAVKLWQRDVNQAQGFIEQAQRLAVTAMQEVRRSVSTLRADVREEPYFLSVGCFSNKKISL
ncbi:MAG: histidine kinase [Cyanobacteria bacterium CRU_2_1]|nr:histidine kinase [Cyanobacteria bacterium CRU_2_1]